MSSRKIVRALLVSTILCAAYAAPAMAQDIPVRQSIDANGVDLFHGTFNVDTPGISIGAGDGLSYKRIWRGSGFTDPYDFRLFASSGGMTVVMGSQADSFVLSGSDFLPTEGNGAGLTYNGTDTYIYTQADGTKITFSTDYGINSVVVAQATSIVRPSGDILTFSYDGTVYCNRVEAPAGDDVCMEETWVYRLANVASNTGYQIAFDYAAANVNYWPPIDSVSWTLRRGGSAYNNAAPGGPTAVLAVTQSHSGGFDYLNVTDPLSRTTTYRSIGAQMLGIKLPGSSSEDVTIGYTASRVSSVTTAAGTVNYASSDAAGVRTVTVTDPLAHVTTYRFDIALQRMTSVTDALAHTTSWEYDGEGRVVRAITHEGNYVVTTYDWRGNATQVDRVARAGSGTATVTTSATYNLNCLNPITCNKPATSTDANGNVTEYTFDPTYGDLLTVTAPAATTGGIRPKTTYSYSLLQAYYTNGLAIVASGKPVRRLTGVSVCRTTASCVGTADEVKKTIGYGPQVAGTGNNLLPVSVTTGAGDSSLIATTTNGYDAAGNLVTVNGPLPSPVDDTTTYRYDAARQLVGVISPDPDAGGALKRRAQRTTYNAHGIATVSEVGTVNGTSNGDWAAFNSAQQLTTTLDGADRPLKQVLTAGGTTYQVTQYSYDAAGRAECVALRMNSATWGSLPASACTLATTGAAGPDRITRTTYDEVNRAKLVQTAYGTADQADEAASTFTPNGKLWTLTDGQANKTTYEYNGIDRLVKTRYPSTTAGSGASSTTDYEQLDYDPNGNVTSRRLRDGTSVAYTYDKLNRVTLTDLPSPDADIASTYDLLGRPLTVSRGGTANHTMTYDALGRLTSEVQPFGWMSYQYDLAGNRVVQLWNDGFYVTYDHLVTGEVTAIRENGAASGIGVLATYAYDDLGRRTGITRGNGTTTSYGFDGASRLLTLGQNLAGTTYDLNLGFSYNPANQIVSTTRSNDLYANTGNANLDRAYTNNGLNQFTALNGAGVGYDGRGNLTNGGALALTYNSQNALKTISGPGTLLVATLSYDGLGRLSNYNSPVSTSERLVYDGSHIATEINPAGAIAQRYVFGPAGDEPIIWYEGAGTTDRRWLHSDERGSIIAVTDASGATLGVNTYDEYGTGPVANIGRFQYTGQAFFRERSLYYYKSRFYSSRFGRFLQPDPIGYEAGMNMYNYVGGDPVNFTDPTGMDRQPGEGDSPVPGCPIGDFACYYRLYPDDIVVIGQRYNRDAFSIEGEIAKYNFLEQFMYSYGIAGVGAAQGKRNCGSASFGNIRRDLPSKGGLSQIRDGVSSYVEGAAWGGTALIAWTGLLGDGARQQAIDTNSRLGDVFDQIASHPWQTATAVGAAASKYPLQLGGRVGSGVAVSYIFSPYIGIPVTVMAAYGSAFKEAYQHPDVVATAVIVGQVCL